MKLTNEQSEVFAAIMQWVKTDKKPVAILVGSAGTGKTTLLKSVVESLEGAKKTYVLLAPTGRGARILGRKTGKPSKTIHSEIYELGDIKADEHSDTIQGDFDSPGFTIPFKLKDAVGSKATVYIVDEASMVSDKPTHDEILSFGSGRLLHDLLHYARIINSSNNKVKILFVGDEAQLPPVKCSDSPALLKKYFLTEFKIDSDVFSLHKVHRQTEGSLILENAEKIRESITSNEFVDFNISEDGNTVKKVEPSQAVKNAIEEQDAGNSVIITLSNKNALSYNLEIRNGRFGAPKIPVQKGDVLLVQRNSPKYKCFNGDLLIAVDVDQNNECRSINIKGGDSAVDIYYRNIIVRSVDEEGDKYNRECKIIENLLYKPSGQLSRLENRAMLVDFRKRHPKIEINSEEFRLKLLSDEYFNALWVKFGYAMTCHKAQGGEWDNVTVNFSYFPGRPSDFYRWAYTAITRGRKTLSVINPPSFGTPAAPFVFDKKRLLENIDARLSDVDNAEFRRRLEMLLNGSDVGKEFTEHKNAHLLANAGAPWSQEEDDELSREFAAKISIAELAKRHGRTQGAINSRLVRLGKIPGR